MANEESGSPLRRWRPFYGAFGAIDDAVEAAGHPRAAYQDARVRILKLLRAATDGGVAEQFCAALDDAMVEALETLRVTPVPHSTPASTDLARAVGALRNHGSARIRRLAGDVVRGWRSAAIDKLSGDRIASQGTSAPAKMLPAPAGVEVHKTKLHVSPPVKMLPTATTVPGRRNTSEVKEPVAPQSEKTEAKKPVAVQSKVEKLEITKRKLREGYQEAEKIKRQHIIQKVNDKEAAKIFERSQQRKMHRGPARCRISSGVSLIPSLQLV